MSDDEKMMMRTAALTLTHWIARAAASLGESEGVGPEEAQFGLSQFFLPQPTVS